MITASIYPFTFKPYLQHYIWGGRNFETLFDRTLPPGITAESWEISGHPNGVTEVNNGPLAGKSLPEVLAEFGEALVGTRAQWALERNKFPLLIKLLDANQNLSVQVHPRDDYALANENGELGKTEMWYVLRAEPGAELIFGLKENVTPHSFRRAIEENSLESQLHYLPIQAGDAIFVEAGSVHALLKGVVVAEIQQNSDVTYRVYDWGRVGAGGNPRQLHIDKAIDVTNFNQVEPGPYQPRLISAAGGVIRAEISRCEYFVVEKVTFKAGKTWPGHTDGSTLEIWGAVDGRGVLHWDGGESIDLPAIRFCLLPAVLGAFSVTATTDCTMLRSYLP